MPVISMRVLPTTLPLKKLPVWATIREAFSFVWDHRHGLWLWVVVGAALAGLASSVDPSLILGEEEVENVDLFGLKKFGVACLASMPSTLVFVVLAVYCHRAILIFSHERAFNLQVVFTAREWRFFFWLLWVYVATLLCAIPGSITAGIFLREIGEIYTKNTWMKSILEIFLFYGVFLLPLYYIMGRWSLVFPAIAVDGLPKMGWSWKQTKGNGWRMLVLVGCIPMTIWYLSSVLPLIGLSEYPGANSFLGSFVLFLFSPVEVAVISIAFRELTNWNPSTLPPEEAPVS